MLTLEELKSQLPANKRHLANQKIVDMMNAPGDKQIREVYRENMLRFTDLLSDHKNGFKVSLEQYAKAIRFVSHRLFGDTVLDAWRRVFPDRYKRLVRRSVPEREMYSHAGAYARGKLPTAIMERSLIPIHILNMDIHQEAINTQAHLMRFAKSEMVRMKAADSLIQHLKLPEDKRLQIDVTHHSGQDAFEELRRVTRELALEQRQAIEDKRVNVIDIANSDIVRSPELIELYPVDDEDRRNGGNGRDVKEFSALPPEKTSGRLAQ